MSDVPAVFDELMDWISGLTRDELAIAAHAARRMMEDSERREAELDVVTNNLAASLDPVMREPFRRALAIELARYPADAIRAGLVNRIGRQLQPSSRRSYSWSPSWPSICYSRRYHQKRRK